MADSKYSKPKKSGRKTIEKKVVKAVKSVSSEVESNFLRYLRESHVPVFSQLASKITLGQYISNHELFMKILDENCTEIIHGYLRHAIAAVAANLARETIKEAQETYPGYWENEFDTLSMIWTHLVPIEGTTDMILTTENSTSVNAGMLDEYKQENKQFMTFSGYSPEALTLMVKVIGASVVSSIVTMINNRFPKMEIAGSDKITAVQRYPAELGSILPDSIKEFTTATPTESSILKVFESCEKLITTYLVNLVHAAGVATDAINRMIDKLSITDLYEIEGIKTMNDVRMTQVFAIPGLKNANGQDFSTTYVFTLGDLCSMLSIDSETTPFEIVSKTKRTTLGTNIRKTVMDLCSMVIANEISMYEMSKPADPTSEN